MNSRKQYVYINGETSQLKDISCGVPQVSDLGPLLFLIYINDLPNISKVLHFFLFADDTNIYYEAESPEKLEHVMNKELRELHKWLVVNRLSLNIDKTNFTCFTIEASRFHKKAILEKNYIKYLGVMIDFTLSWHTHIENILKKCQEGSGCYIKLDLLLI